jgi:hypothetical protein
MQSILDSNLYNSSKPRWVAAGEEEQQVQHRTILVGAATCATASKAWVETTDMESEVVQHLCVSRRVTYSVGCGCGLTSQGVPSTQATVELCMVPFPTCFCCMSGRPHPRHCPSAQAGQVQQAAGRTGGEMSWVITYQVFNVTHYEISYVTNTGGDHLWRPRFNSYHTRHRR